MTVESTSRFGLTKWTEGTDEFTRAQMNDSHQNIEDLGAILRQGSSSPVGSVTPGGGNARSLYYATGTGLLYYSDGSTWKVIGGIGASYRFLRQGSTAPTDNLNNGDLWFDTSVNELKVRIGGAWVPVTRAERRPVLKIEQTTAAVHTANTDVFCSMDEWVYPTTTTDKELWTAGIPAAIGFGVVIPYTGLYQVNASISYGAIGSGYRRLWLVKAPVGGGAAENVRGGEETTPDSAAGVGNYTSMTISTIVPLTAGDTLKTYGRTTVSTTCYGTTLDVIWLGTQ